MRVLTEAAARGDAGAVDQLLQAHLPGLRAFVRLRVGPELRARESSSDIVQSVCREVLEHLDRFQHPGEKAFKHWLYTTALRKIASRADYYRAQKREGGREVLSADEEELGRLYRTLGSPSQGAVLREELERLESAFDQLSDEQREVVTLAHLVGLTRAEIAERIGKTEGAVRVILHRALARLSSQM